MGWRVNFVPDDEGNEKCVDLDDLSPDTFAAIAKDVDAGLTYWGIYAFPRETPEILYRVICAAAAHAGIAPPAAASNMRDQRLLDAMLEETTDPKETSDLESGSSTTSLESPTDGLQVSSDESPSET